jgi:hypothetical protein
MTANEPTNDPAPEGIRLQSELDVPGGRMVPDTIDAPVHYLSSLVGGMITLQ